MSARRSSPVAWRLLGLLLHGWVALSLLCSPALPATARSGALRAEVVRRRRSCPWSPPAPPCRRRQRSGLRPPAPAGG